MVKDRILFIGPMAGFDKGICNYINLMNQRLENYEVVVVNTAISVSEETIKSKLKCKYINVPKILNVVALNFDEKFSLTDEIVTCINQNEEISLALENYKKRFELFLVENQAENTVYEAYKYFHFLLENYNPKVIILWNKFSAIHSIFDYLSKKNSIKTFYAEFGVLPGTFSIEDDGQMGESFPSIKYDEFQSISINFKDIIKTRNILKDLRESKLNRNIQPKNDLLDKIKLQINNDFPIIFYAGQNDYESGLFPYSEHTKKFHSPTFKSTNEAFEYLLFLAKKNKWNLIYKRHPLMSRLSKRPTVEGCIIVDDIDISDLIDFSDVVVTILSQVSYLSLIREKPLVILGFTQLKNKECCYESYSLNTVEDSIKLAIKNGYTSKQKIMFEEHCSRLIKSYIYDDLLDKEIKYDMSINEYLEYILEKVENDITK